MTKKQKLSPHMIVDTDPAPLYEFTGELGDGSFGKVWKATHVATKRVTAVKVIQIENEDELEDFQVELDILKVCNHENITKVFDAYLYKDHLWLEMELCGGGALDDIYQELDCPLDEQQIQTVVHYMLKALNYCEEKFIMHRDLKAGNILLTRSGKVKLCDFGVSALCKEAGERRNTFIGTPYWMAPEVILCDTNKDKPYDNRCDIWSLAIVCIELAEMNPPYADMHPMRVLFKIPKAPTPTLAENEMWTKDFPNFLARCLVKDPDNRPRAKDLMSDVFVTNKTDVSCLKELVQQFNTPAFEEMHDMDEEEPEEIDIANDNLTLPTPEHSEKHDSFIEETDIEIDKKNMESCLPAPSTDTEKFTTLTRTRTIQRGGKMVTIRSIKVISAAETEKVVDLKASQLRETKLLQRKQKNEYKAIQKRLATEKNKSDLSLAKECDILEKKNTSELANFDNKTIKDLEKFQASQTKELAALKKKQKAEDSAAWKAHRAAQKIEEKHIEADQKAARSALDKAAKKEQKIADQKIIEAERFKQDEVFGTKIATDQKKELWMFELKQLEEAENKDKEILVNKHAIMSSQRAALKEQSLRTLEETQIVECRILKESDQQQRDHLSLRNNLQKDHQRAMFDCRDVELNKKHRMKRKQLPITQKATYKKNLKAFVKKRLQIVEERQKSYKEIRSTLQRPQDKKTLKKQQQDEIRAELKRIEKEFTDSEQALLRKEAEEFEKELMEEASALNRVHEREDEELKLLQDEKLASFEEESAERIRVMSARHQEEMKTLNSAEEKSDTALSEVFSQEQDSLDGKYAIATSDLNDRYSRMPLQAKFGSQRSTNLTLQCSTDIIDMDKVSIGKLSSESNDMALD